MQVIENRADVTGRLVGTRPHPELKDYLAAKLEVGEVKAVAGFANLFETAKGQTIDVNVPVAAMAENRSRAGDTVSWRIRKAGPAANFTVQDLH